MNHRYDFPMRLSFVVAVLLVASACSKPADDPTDHGHSDVGTDVGTTDASDTRPGDVDVDTPDSAADAADLPVPRTDVPFNEAVFRSTHNSYSGDARGSIQAQLDQGVRFIEFDVHADEFAARGFEVGHDAPDDEVDHEGNPPGTQLGDWFDVVQQWRAENPTHLPLTIGLDMKDGLSSLPSASLGNLGALNDLVVATFEDALVTEANVADEWPTVDELRGRVLVVLSGDTDSRLDYRRTRGLNPAIAAADGAVVVAHQFGNQTKVWYGAAEGMDGFDIVAGTDPAVAVSDDAAVLVLQTAEGLSFRAGTLQGSAVEWSDSVALPDSSGLIEPSVRFTDADTALVVATNGAGELAHLEGTRAAGDWSWTTVTSTAPRFDETTDGALSVASVSEPPYVDSIQISSAGASHRLRLKQAMFSESQFSGPPEFETDGVLFYATSTLSAAGGAWALEKRASGHLVRFWQFNLPNVVPNPGPNFPATDRPSSDFYADYCSQVGCVGP